MFWHGIGCIVTLPSEWVLLSLPERLSPLKLKPDPEMITSRQRCDCMKHNNYDITTFPTSTRD